MYICLILILLIFFAGNFKAGPEQGTILKKLCPKEELCFQVLMKDVLRPYVPEYKGHVTCEDGDCILVIKSSKRPRCRDIKFLFVSGGGSCCSFPESL